MLKPLGEQSNFIAWLKRMAQSEWVVYAKPPFGGPQQVLKYLARYTHRVAISNQRLVALHDGLVTFRWKDYAHGGQPAIMTLQATEFIRRFLLHVLPQGFVRIRHFGFLANRCRQHRLQLCRKLLDIKTTANPESSNPRDDSLTKQKAPEPPDRCPVCKVGCLKPVEILLPQRSTISGSRARLVIAIPETDTS